MLKPTKPYKPDQPVKERIHEITVGRYKLRKGMFFTIEPGGQKPRLKRGRYLFLYAEICNSGALLIHAEGPITPKHDSGFLTSLYLDNIRTVHHEKTRRQRAKEEE
jgi:hypothetical protein